MWDPSEHGPWVTTQVAHSLKLALPPMSKGDLCRSQKNRGPIFWAHSSVPSPTGTSGGRGSELFVYHISPSLLLGRLMSPGQDGGLQRDHLSTCPDPCPSLKGTGRQDAAQGHTSSACYRVLPSARCLVSAWPILPPSTSLPHQETILPCAPFADGKAKQNGGFLQRGSVLYLGCVVVIRMYTCI